MLAIVTASVEPNSRPLKLGAVLYPGFTLLDIYGPLQMFCSLPDRFSVVMTGENSGVIPSDQGPKGIADVALAEATDLDILVVPGGWGTRKEVQNIAFLELLKARSETARYVASICTGSALLAKAGVLDGRKATSNKRAFDWVVTQGPGVQWIREARWVEDGKFFTSSGVSAGMDMALGLIQRLAGRETSLQVARRAEYTWHEDKNFDPFANPPA